MFRRKFGLIFLALSVASVLGIADQLDVSVHSTTGWLEVDASSGMAWMSFNAVGEFDANVLVSSQAHDLFDTDIYAFSSSEASFMFVGSQDFFDNNNEVFTSAYASGDTYAFMNLRFDTSMYIVQLEESDHHQDFLAAGGAYAIGYGMMIRDRDSLDASAWVQVGLEGEGGAVMGANQWFPVAQGSYGWGNPDSIVAPNPPGYYHPVNYAVASGEGDFYLSMFGENYVQLGNAVVMPGGGTLDAFGNFSDGFQFFWDSTVVR